MSSVEVAALMEAELDGAPGSSSTAAPPVKLKCDLCGLGPEVISKKKAMAARSNPVLGCVSVASLPFCLSASVFQGSQASEKAGSEVTNTTMTLCLGTAKDH